MRKRNWVYLLIIFILLVGYSCRGRRVREGAIPDSTSLSTDGGAELIDSEEQSDVEISEAPEEPVVQVADVKIALPLNHIDVSSSYGQREDPITGEQKDHKGIDLSASSEYPLAMMNGKVLAVGCNSSAGNFVTLKHGKLTVTYCHLSKIYVKPNTDIVAGTKIGMTGSTGRSTGEHLHLTCKLNNEYIDPEILLEFISSTGIGNSSIDSRGS